MLEAAGVPFEAGEAPLDEEEAKKWFGGLGPVMFAGALAEAKARSVMAGPSDLVLGSDQVLERNDGTMLGKPGSRDEAMEQLRSLSGRKHWLHSAAVIMLAGEVVWECTETVEMTVRPLSDAFLGAYLDEEFETIRWSVGGYHVEGRGAQLFERIDGSHFAVLGLPLLPLLAFLRERGVLPT
jgi:septum formation protein